MRFNVFSGARRLGGLCCLASCFAVLVATYQDRQKVTVMHNGSGGQPTVIERCGYVDRYSITLTGASGIPLEHCFYSRYRDGVEYVALAPGLDGVSVTSNDTQVITTYINGLAVSPALKESISSEHWRLTASWVWELIWRPVACAVAWLVAMACIGWVVRGFMGIPTGKDER